MKNATFFLGTVLYFIICSVFVTDAAAASLGDMAQNTTTDVLKFGPLAQACAAVGGIFLIIAGLFELQKTSRQPGQPKGPAFAGIVIGIILLGVAVFAMSASQSFFGTDAASSGLNKLGIR